MTTKKKRHPTLERLGQDFRKFRHADSCLLNGKEQQSVSMLEYARVCDVSWATIQNLEAGDGFPSILGWCNICNKLQISTEELFIGQPSARLDERISNPQFKISPQAIGEDMQGLRKCKGWTIADAWKYSGLSKHTIQKLERGEGELNFLSLVKLVETYKDVVQNVLLSAEKALTE